MLGDRHRLEAGRRARARARIRATSSGVRPSSRASSAITRVGVLEPVGDEVDPEVGAVDRHRLAVAVDDPAAPRRDQPHLDAVLLGELRVALVLGDRDIAHPRRRAAAPTPPCAAADHEGAAREGLRLAALGDRAGRRRTAAASSRQPPAVEPEHDPRDDRISEDREPDLRKHHREAARRLPISSAMYHTPAPWKSDRRRGEQPVQPDSRESRAGCRSDRAQEDQRPQQHRLAERLAGTRSANRPSRAPTCAGQISGRSSRQVISTRKPRSGSSGVEMTIGSSDEQDRDDGRGERHVAAPEIADRDLGARSRRSGSSRRRRLRRRRLLLQRRAGSADCSAAPAGAGGRRRPGDGGAATGGAALVERRRPRRAGRSARRSRNRCAPDRRSAGRWRVSPSIRITLATGTSGGKMPPTPEVTSTSPRRNGFWPTSSVRSSIVPSPRPTAIAGVPSRGERTGTMLAPSVTSSTREAQRPVSSTRPIRPSARAHRHARPRRPTLLPADRVASRRGAVEGRADDPRDRDLVLRLAGEAEQGAQPPVLDLRAPAARSSSRRASASSLAQLGILRAGAEIVADRRRRCRRRSRRRERPAVLTGAVTSSAAPLSAAKPRGSMIAMASSSDGDDDAGHGDDIADEQAVLRPAGESGAPVARRRHRRAPSAP